MHAIPGTDPAHSSHRLPVLPVHWQPLHMAVLQVWHEQTSRRAGLQRATTVQLLLGQTWTDCIRGQPGPQQLAGRLAADGAEVQVLVIPDLCQPELHIGWVPWRAPPLHRRIPELATHRTTAWSSTAPSNTTPTRQPHCEATALYPTDRSTRIMKLPNLRQLFTPEPSTVLATTPEPRLEPSGQRAAPSPARQLPQALQQIAEQIDEQEVRQLLDTVDCRYQLWELTFYLTPGNQGPLRGLMAAHQQNPLVARQIVERAFASASCAGRLNTLRLKLDFKRGDSLPREVSEVLVVCGRDNVTLPYTYTGQLELDPAGADGQPIAAPRASASSGSSSLADKAATPGQGTTGLLLWGQTPDTSGTPTVQCWRLDAGPVTLGAADGATVLVNHRHVSGEHLLLTLDDQGHWTVEDRSRNGSALLDAVAGDGEKPLPMRQPQRLPAAGWLRLGPLPDDPTLSFHLVTAAMPAPAPAPSGPRRRVTELASSFGPALTPASRPAPVRATDLPQA